MKKFEHLQHVEDLPLFILPFDVMRLCHRPYTISLSCKHDGSIGLVFGKDDGRFFLATKSFFNKTPEKFFNIDQILFSKKDPELKEKLLLYWEDLKQYQFPLLNNFFMMCDVMSDPWSQIDGDINHAKPNLIEYDFSVPETSSEWYRTERCIYYVHYSQTGVRRGINFINQGALMPSLADIDYKLGYTKKEIQDIQKDVNQAVRENDAKYWLAFPDQLKKPAKILIFYKKMMLDICKLSYSTYNSTKGKIGDQVYNFEGMVYRELETDIAFKYVDRLNFSRLNMLKWDHNK